MTYRPKLLILGYGRHGKDTVAEIIRDKYGLQFTSSSHFAAERIMVPYFASIGESYSSVDECYADRANHRALWHDKIAEYNSPNKDKLAHELLNSGCDMYVGMRCEKELAASRYLFDAICWVDSSERGIPPEPKSSCTVEYDASHMWLIRNNAGLEELAARVEDFMQFVEMQDSMERILA